jgi:hypothetical protein
MRLNRCTFSSFLPASALLCLIGMPALAQTTSVAGEVTDPSNAAVSGAVVRLTDTATKQALTTSTNDAGRYIFVSVTPGDYSITFTKTGFSTRRIDGQHVEVGLSLTLNAVLELGSTTTIVEVTSAAGAELQTMNATVSGTFTGQALELLPNVSREASALWLNQPGVGPDGSVAGAIYDQNTFRLDGGNNSNDMDGSMTVYTPSFAANGAPTGTVPTPVESIEQIKISTSGMTADFNGSSGGEISMVTKRGTNQFHGSGYEYYFASDVGAANSWDNNHTPTGNLGYTPLPITHNNRFGTSLGGPVLPKMLGGKTYFFFNYEGFRYPQSSVYQRTVPTPLLRLGVIQINEGGTYVPYNLNPTSVTYNGIVYGPAMCSGGTNCDPRGIGINPIVSKVWNTQMPLPNNPLSGDSHNTQGYLSTIADPSTSNNYVGRIDHDFGEKWRWMTSYRQFHWNRATNSQVDIGGAIGGDKLGVPTALSNRPSVPSYWVTGLTTNINPTTTNDFRFSYLRNFWQWIDAGAAPQLAGLGSAIEIGGTSANAESSNALIPYNVDTQDTRQRFWDGHDTTFRDDVTKIKGNHLIQFGGIFEHNYDYHLRNDNGGGIQNFPVDRIDTQSGGVSYPSIYQPANLPSSQINTYNNLYTSVLGITGQSQDLFTRSGPALTLQPPGSYMYDQSTIPFYNVYASDTWHMKPTFTLTYGLGYSVEMPPTEKNGKQVELTNATGAPIVLSDYLASRQSAALGGGTFNPTLGFATVKNVTGGASTKYPYNPYYGGVSPRVSAAWSPRYASGIMGKLFGDGKTVMRGGYGRVYSRLNGVALVLIPLLGTGLGQPVSCIGASMTGQCLGQAGVTPANAFRIGTDGPTAPLPTLSQTLPQPYLPGIGGNASAGAGTVIDPNFRPARTENFNFSIQHEFSSKLLLDVGYIGRLIRNEFQQVDLDAVPTMTTLGGQSFAQAFAGVYTAICGLGSSCAGNASAPVQPFFEAALGGANSSFCKGFSSCTAAVVGNGTMNNQISTTNVYNLWSTLNQASSWTLGRTMPSSPINGGSGQLSAVFSNSSIGYGNYNAGYVSFTVHDWKGFTARSNLTYSKSLGTGAAVQATSEYTTLNPWNLKSMYGPQAFDYKFVYNLAMVYQVPYYRGQKGIVGHVLGGWSIAPLLTAHTGAPWQVYSAGGDCQSFGEGNCSTESSLDGAVLASKYTGGNSPRFNVNVSESSATNPLGVGISTNADNGGQAVNMFKNPIQVFNEFRPCVLGLDTSCGSSGNIRQPGFWNVDATASKDLGLWKEGRVGATLIFQFTNLFNHTVFNAPYMDISDPADFGNMSSNNAYYGFGQANTPRQMEFGVRVHF